MWHLGDEQRLAMLGASPQGEAPGGSTPQPHLHQPFI